ncbi:beta-1,3-galactosyltransferase 5-like [Hyperolius riggenbachi]|uniref:beta-1,3-galactosyltransferase 5-like n=1 Tax=Hyperolius riggenbachi TaxID=752182 RepID=UPI0035A31A05
MAIIRTWCLKILLCLSVFFCTVLLWTWFSQANASGQWLWLFDLGTTSKKKGIDFASLFSTELSEPKCQKKQLLVILVTSNPSHHASRKAIRNTWASSAKGSVHLWQVVFLVGRTLNVELDWHIHKEHKTYGDVLMGSYLDSYRNLTLKVMHGMKWAVERCQPQYLLKTDDDCFVNTQYLPSFLRDNSPGTSPLYVGSAFSEQKRAVIRDPMSKWYVSYREYERDVYPPYASGIGYILSFGAATSVLRMARTVPPIPVEDAYVGILAERVKIQLLTSSRFAKHNVRWSVCNYRFLMVIHGLSPEDQALAQRNVLRTRTMCNHSMEVTHWR